MPHFLMTWITLLKFFSPQEHFPCSKKNSYLKFKVKLGTKCKPGSSCWCRSQETNSTSALLSLTSPDGNNMIPCTTHSAICQAVIMTKLPIQRQHIPCVEHCKTLCKNIKEALSTVPVLAYKVGNSQAALHFSFGSVVVVFSQSRETGTT